jgi:hypothetical protein
MSKETRFRYHNSPKPPPKRWKMSPRFEDFLVQSLACTFIVLTSPIWIPLFLLLLPVRLWRAGCRGRLARQRQEREVMNPSPAPTPIDPELERRRDIARREQKGVGLHDPIGDDPDLAWAFQEARQRAQEEIGGYRKMGDCHRIWNRMQAILKEEFDIVWYTPPQMNPGAKFD